MAGQTCNYQTSALLIFLLLSSSLLKPQIPTPFLSSKWHISLKWFALTEENSILLIKAIMERIPYWFAFYSVIWCILAHYICSHVSNVGYCDLILVKLKPIFSKSLIISLNDLFQTSTSSQKGAVTRFNFRPEITPKWIKYMKHWFSRHYISGKEHWSSAPTLCPQKPIIVLAEGSGSWSSIIFLADAGGPHSSGV